MEKTCAGTEETRRGTVDCPQAHGLRQVVTTEGRACDICDACLKPGGSSFACQECGFDVCTVCMQEGRCRQEVQARKLRQRIESYARQACSYADSAKLVAARDVLPATLVEGIGDEGNGEALLRDTLHWFKADFFKWTDSPYCEKCAMKATKNEGMVDPSEEELCFGAQRVESWRCTNCDTLFRFPRYNDPARLLESRHGRCGEWANCFTLIASALGFRTRLVVDWTDHVWAEVWTNGRWQHCDPCEGCLDAPLTYELGWRKKLTYVVAFSPLEVVDVTARYTSNWPQVLERRTLVQEQELETIIRMADVGTRMESTELPPWRALEEAELADRRSGKASLQSLTSVELNGRASGSLEWRQERGEVGASLPVSVGDSPRSLTVLAKEHCPDTEGPANRAQLLGGAKLGLHAEIACIDLHGEAAAVELAGAVAVTEDAFVVSPAGFTVEAWVAADATLLHPCAHENPIVSRHGPASGWELRLCRQGGAIFLVTIDGVHVEVCCQAETPLWDGSWLHVAGVFDGSMVKVFFNKESRGELPVPEGARSTFQGPLRFGQNPVWQNRCARCYLHSARVTHAALCDIGFLPSPTAAASESDA
eukprot:TRINITY_DN42160_c0_g1_i1.p1 TRINITY_DN42160_c0_g1~~TRINITY_DN42160_c0_g1_i1.p1  ORF type:complete len:611 (-),score=80.37 TRINITY_DN42160_c0_g1_i1:45-1829(-)